MKIWICNTCHAEIPATGQYEKELNDEVVGSSRDKHSSEPKICPICKSNRKGFYEEEREDKKDPEEEKSSKKIQEALEELEKYDEGCEPKKLKYNCEC